jgi:hypothetical protein
MFGSSQSATRSSIEIDAAQVSAILRTPGVTSYLSIHYEFVSGDLSEDILLTCSTSNGSIFTMFAETRASVKLTRLNFWIL